MRMYRVLSKCDPDLFNDGGSNFYELVCASSADAAKKEAAKRRKISADMVPLYKLYTDTRGLPGPKKARKTGGIK